MSNIISAPITIPFKCPVITIPEDAYWNEKGRPPFDIETSEGKIEVRPYFRNSVKCCGSGAALIAAGMMLPQWVPSLPGNNKISQKVVFDEEYPRLIIASRGGYHLDVPHIIMRKSRFIFEIEVQLTELDSTLNCNFCK